MMLFIKGTLKIHVKNQMSNNIESKAFVTLLGLTANKWIGNRADIDRLCGTNT